LIRLASTLPDTALRHAAFQVLKTHQEWGASELLDAGVYLPFVRDPGHLTVLKSLPRKRHSRSKSAAADPDTSEMTWHQATWETLDALRSQLKEAATYSDLHWDGKQQIRLHRGAQPEVSIQIVIPDGSPAGTHVYYTQCRVAPQRAAERQRIVKHYESRTKGTLHEWQERGILWFDGVKKNSTGGRVTMDVVIEQAASAAIFTIEAIVVIAQDPEAKPPTYPQARALAQREARTAIKPPDVNIFTATVEGDLEAVNQHIATGTDLNQSAPDEKTPLMVAAAFGRTEIVKALIEAGAKLDLKDKDGGTALMTAAFFCHTEIVQALLDKGADKNIRNNDGSTALQSVEAPFGAVRFIYEMLDGLLFKPLAMPLDYERITATRPKIAEILRSSGHDAAPQPAGDIFSAFRSFLGQPKAEASVKPPAQSKPAAPQPANDIFSAFRSALGQPNARDAVKPPAQDKPAAPQPADDIFGAFRSALGQPKARDAVKPPAQDKPAVSRPAAPQPADDIFEAFRRTVEKNQ